MQESPAQEIAVMNLPREEPLTGWLRVIDKMIDKNCTADLLTQVFALQQKSDAEMQRKAFVEAFAAFKAEAPTAIERTGSVSFGSGDKKVGYDHVELDVACERLTPLLSKHGLAHSWEPTQDDKGVITVACRLEHAGGYSRSVSLRGMPDASGSKNPIQAVGSAVYYLERYTFLAVLGIAQRNGDTDAAQSWDTLIKEEQETLAKLIADKKADLARFLKWAKVKDLAEIPRKKFAEAVDLLNKKGGSK